MYGACPLTALGKADSPAEAVQSASSFRVRQRTETRSRRCDQERAIPEGAMLFRLATVFTLAFAVLAPAVFA